MALSGSLNFISSSYFSDAYTVNPFIEGQDWHLQGLPNTFVPLNIWTSDPVSASSNTLGLPHTEKVIDYGHGQADRKVEGDSSGFGHGIRVRPDASGGRITITDLPNLTHNLILKRNGPYQHPTWKQYRGGDHPVARSLRLNNTMSVDLFEPDARKREDEKRFFRTKMEHGSERFKEFAYFKFKPGPFGAPGVKLEPSASLKSYYEPSVVSKYKPIVYDVDSGFYYDQPTVTIRSTLMNEMVFFENHDLNEALKIASVYPLTGTQVLENFKTPNQEYFQLLDVATDPTINGKNFLYSQTIFPRSINAYRPYKLNRPNYEEVAGLGSNGFDRVTNRTFWRNTQPLLDDQISVDGTTRIRTPRLALNSQEITQHIYYRNLLFYPLRSSEAYGLTAFPTLLQIAGVNHLIGTSSAVPTLGSTFNPPIMYIEGGVVVSYGVNTLTGTARGPDGLPTGGFPFYANHETHNPYPIALLSPWPLDVRPDIFSGTMSENPTAGSPDIYQPLEYLTSSIGGQGMQIGVTPHRLKEYFPHMPASPGIFGSGSQITASTSPVFTASLGYIFNPSGVSQTTLVPPIGGGVSGQFLEPYTLNTAFKEDASGSYHQLFEIQTGSAGELVYSTKPTMFFHGTGTFGGALQYPKGYRMQTASMQYNRHAHPYNTPFYATNLIRKRNPFENSYSDFSVDSKYVARDFSLLPEYRISDNIEYYLETYFPTIPNSKAIYEIAPKKEFRLDPDVTYNDGHTNHAHSKSKVTRLINITAEQIHAKEPNVSKLNNLTIVGADVTSSALIDNVAEQAPTTNNFAYDSLTMSPVDSSLEEAQLLWSQDRTSVAFFEKFSHTDNLVELSHILHKFDQEENTIPNKIEFSVSALKKLLPYKNFYPVTKTLDVGNKFKKFIYDNLNLAPDFTLDENQNPVGSTYESKISSSFINDSIADGALQAFLEPMFAPGILYNSIKSGIAVDYPIYEDKPAYFAPFSFLSGTFKQGSGQTVGGSIDFSMFGFLGIATGKIPVHSVPDVPTTARSENTNRRFDAVISSSFPYGGFQMLGASRCIPAILNRNFTATLPFEALYNTSYFDDYAVNRSIYLPTDFLDLDINSPQSSSIPNRAKVVGPQAGHHPGYAFTNTGPRGRLIEQPSKMNSIDKKLYESSINNFLCETMNFFVDDQSLPGVKLPIVVSKPKSDTSLSFIDDKEFYMEVSLEMGKDQVMTEGPRNAGVGGGASIDNHYANDNLNATMRGALYGPPMEVVQMSGNAVLNRTTETFAQGIDPTTGDLSFRTEPYIATYVKNYPNDVTNSAGDYESYFAANLQDPAYQAFTPPYFYGKSSVFYGFSSTSNQTSYKEAVVKSRFQSFYLEQYVTGASQDALCRFLPGTSSISYLGNPGGSRMKIDSSMDIFNDPIQITVTEQVDDSADTTQKTTTQYVSYITPKWVCPVLDFSASYSTVRDSYTVKGEKHTFYSFITNSFHDTKTGRGLWGGYGTDPYGTDMSVVNKKVAAQDSSAAKKYQKGLKYSIKYPHFISQNSKEDVVFASAQIGNNSGFYINRQDGIYQRMKATGSLGEELGFLDSINDIKEFEIGKIANEKEIKEAVVIIPYFDRQIRIKPNDDNLKGFPNSEFYSTREIIPGRHFLPIHTTFFENMLTMNVAKRSLIGVPGDPVERLVAEKSFIGFNNMNEAAQAETTDVYEMIDVIMGDDSENRPGFELPPEFDMVNYNVAPFQMIIHPISHTLNKQELLDIYQGIMPDSSIDSEVSKTSISVNPSRVYDDFLSWVPAFGPKTAKNKTLSIVGVTNFLSPAFINGKKTISDTLDIDNSINYNWLKSSKDFYQNLKFMVFKVKEKGKKDYTKYKSKQIERVIKNKTYNSFEKSTELGFGANLYPGGPEFSEVFGYNWPYDDFSLIESVKIDVGVEVEK